MNTTPTNDERDDGRRSFTFRHEYREALKCLPAEVRLEVLEAIVDYGCTGTLPESMSPMAAAMLTLVQSMVDDDLAGTNVQRRSNNPQGRPRKTASETENGSVLTDQKQKITEPITENIKTETENISVFTEPETENNREKTKNNSVSSRARTERDLNINKKNNNISLSSLDEDRGVGKGEDRDRDRADTPMPAEGDRVGVFLDFLDREVSAEYVAKEAKKAGIELDEYRAAVGRFLRMRDRQKPLDTPTANLCRWILRNELPAFIATEQRRRQERQRQREREDADKKKRDEMYERGVASPEINAKIRSFLGSLNTPTEADAVETARGIV